MLVRPRDICTAAFENDVERLRLLVTDGVLGGYHGFKESQWMINKKTVMSKQHERFQQINSIENQSLESQNKDDQSGSTRAQLQDDINKKVDDDDNDDKSDDDDDESEEEIELDDEDEAKLDNDVEYTRVKRQYAMDESNSDNDNDNDDDDDDDNSYNSDGEQGMVGEERYNEYGNEGAANGNTHRQSKTHVRYDKEREMARQERDLKRYRELIRNKLRQTEMAAKLNVHDVIYYTSVMNVPSAHVEDRTPYGFFCTIHEELQCPQQSDNKPASTYDCAGTAVGACTVHSNIATDQIDEAVHQQNNTRKTELEQLKLRVTWKPSKRSPFIASPLHWAVLGRAHEAVKYLVAHGANVHDEVTFAESNHKATTTTTATAKDSKEQQQEYQHYFSKNCTSESDMHGALAKHSGLTAEKVAKDNRSHHTCTILKKAMANQEREEQLELLMRQWLESKMEQRKAKKEKHKLERDQRRVAREEAVELRERRAQELEEQQEEEEEEEDGETPSAMNDNEDDGDDNENGEDDGNMESNDDGNE